MTLENANAARGAGTRSTVNDAAGPRRRPVNPRSSANPIRTESVALMMLLVDELRRTATSSVELMRDRAGDLVTAFADGVRTAANELRPENEALASIVESGDATLRGWASGLRETAAEDLVRNLHVAVRRRPALFLAGTLVAGVAVAHVLKRTGDRRGRRSAPPSAGY